MKEAVNTKRGNDASSGTPPFFWRTLKHARLVAVGICLLLLPGMARAQTTPPPCPSGTICSGSVTFTVNLSAPTTPASVSPTSATAGATSAVTLTLTPLSGLTFNAQMTVQACQVTPTPCTTPTALTTTFNTTSGTLTATFPVSLLASSGTFAIYIAQPANAHASNLKWDGSISLVAGYNVYRGDSSGGPTRSSIPHSSAA